MNRIYQPDTVIQRVQPTKNRPTRSRVGSLTGGSLLMLLLGSLHVTAQQPLRVTAEVGQYGSSSGRTPFWLRSNQYGTVPQTAPTTTARLSAYVGYDSVRLFTRRITYGYGLSVVGNTAPPTGTPNDLTKGLLLPEAYASVRWRAFEVYAGRRREQFGLGDSTLSTGHYAWSGNALPIPKVQIEIRQFAPIGFTKGFVAVKGSFAHGWLGGNYVQHTLLHQKTFYVRLGKPKSRFKLYGGVNHTVIWGGESEQLVQGGLTKTAQLPSSFVDYLSLVSGLRSSQTGLTDAATLTDFDLTNRIGNHLGSVDAAAELRTNALTFYLYRENPVETGATFYGTSIADGLNGLRIRSNKPNALIGQVLFEFLSTISQGGPEFVITDPKRRGRVNYFNHQQYRDGWTYHQRGVGTPFITPALGPNGEWPYGTFTNNNRVQVYHLGVAGSLLGGEHAWLNGPVTYQTKLSYSRNMGTYIAPFPSDIYQFSGLATVAVPLALLNGLSLTGSFAWDSGGLYARSAGFYVGLRKDWLTSVR